TQLLPSYLAWYANQLPDWAQTLSTLAVLGFELLLPFCIFAPRRIRLWGGGALIILQLLFSLTGNHGFINLLLVALGVTLFDDRALLRIVGPGWAARFRFPRSEVKDPPVTNKRRSYKLAAIIAGVTLLLSASVIETCVTLSGVHTPRFLRSWGAQITSWGMGG